MVSDAKSEREVGTDVVFFGERRDGWGFLLALRRVNKRGAVAIIGFVIVCWEE